MQHKIKVETIGPRGLDMVSAIEDCVHCGFCLPSCPTYQELGDESESPRGRILLMKSALEGDLSPQEVQPSIDRCLGCVSCVTNCPSGVEYGELLASYRSHIASGAAVGVGDAASGGATQGSQLASVKPPRRPWRQRLLRAVLPYRERFRWAARLGLWTRPLHGWLPASLRPMVALLPQHLPARQRWPSFTPAEGGRRGRVALLLGCAQDVLVPDITAAATRVLARHGFDVFLPSEMGCCGALAWHLGHSEDAQRHARQIMQAIPEDIDAFVTTAAGCGSAIKEYPLILRGCNDELAAERLAAKTVDISQLLDRLTLQPIPPLRQPLRVAYQDACHLRHAQRVAAAPRRLLEAVPGLEWVELPEPDICCGSAGTYNIDQPELADRLGKRKAASVERLGVQAVVTGNVGCLMQLQKHLRNASPPVAVLHTVQILDRAYQQILT